jgi:hypothetical protein
MKILASLGLVVIALLVTIWPAFILTYLWSWFVVPWVHLPPLSLGYAYGLMLIVGFVANGNKKQEEVKADPDKSFEEVMGKAFGAIMTSCLSGALTLGFGYIIHLIIR